MNTHFLLQFGWTPRKTKAGTYHWQAWLLDVQVIGPLFIQVRCLGFYAILHWGGVSMLEADHRRLQSIVGQLREQQAIVRASWKGQGAAGEGGRT